MMFKHNYNECNLPLYLYCSVHTLRYHFKTLRYPLEDFLSLSLKYQNKLLKTRTFGFYTRK